MSEDPQQVVETVQILLLLTVLALVPAILLLMVSFTRIVIVLSFVRSALATQQTPPNQVLIGLALFLTFFIMAPVAGRSKRRRLIHIWPVRSPRRKHCGRRGPVREFLYRQTREKDLALFVHMAGLPPPETRADVPMHVIVPAFVISELKTAFQMLYDLYPVFDH